MPTLASLTKTDVVNQEFFIEELGGPQHIVTILEQFFPESIYSQDIDSNLANLLFALVGPAGVGNLRREYLRARLAAEHAGLEFSGLDQLYGEPFEFARLASEVNEFTPEELLTPEQKQQVKEADAKFRNRAIDFLKGARAGGTLLGLTLAAKSGLARPVEIVENYKYLYDQYSDRPMYLEYLGRTASTEEAIVIPHQDQPKSCIQTLTASEDFASGKLIIQFPYGPKANYEGETLGIAMRDEVPGEYENIEAHEIQTALEKLKNIGETNVVVTGGPFPTLPVTVEFINELSERELPELIAKFETLGSVIKAVFVHTTQNGIGQDQQLSSIQPADWHHAFVAMNQIKPVTTILTPNSGRGLVKRQPIALSFSDSTFITVTRYVTGRSQIAWPEDSIHWIRGGQEIAAPRLIDGTSHHYVNFHNISKLVAYQSSALADPEYDKLTYSQLKEKYKNERGGEFTPYEKALAPTLKRNQGLANELFAAEYAAAAVPNLLTVDGVVSGEGLIEGIYPVDYANINQTSSIPTNQSFWASEPKPEGIDVLEIDLGEVQAVNTIYFKMTSKPYSIEIEYDLLDNGPERLFTPVTYDTQKASCPTMVIYEAVASNQWKIMEYSITDALGEMIYTRYIRIKLTRRPGTPFVLSDQKPLPYGAEIEQLRVGRVL